MSPADYEALRPYMTEAERAEFDRLLADFTPPIWEPLKGPQTFAYASKADIIGFGGAAGGGKTDLAIGKALTQHQKIIVIRKNGTEHLGMVDRLTEILGGKDGWSAKEGGGGVWTVPNAKARIEFGSVPNMGDEQKYRGRPHDLIIYDEAAEIPEFQIRFLMAWNRTTDPNQKCQTLLTFNPPSSAEGRWLIEFFAPWIDRKYVGKRAVPGELRWFVTIDGHDKEVESPEPFEYKGEIVIPRSRTFIPSRVTDNPHLVGTNYVSQLQALPEPLRSQMLYGSFEAGMEDDAMQLIPTEWVDAAMARWIEPAVKPPMDSLGVDVARGGRDNTVIARRHGMWFDKAIVHPGSATPDGPTVAGYTLAALRDNAPIHIDVIGVGSSPYDFLNTSRIQVYGVNVSEAARGLDKSGRLRFFNLRTELWWRMREALDPNANNGIALPPDKRLAADLCAPKWRVQGKTVQVESRDDIEKRIKRSPDWASAYVLALIDTPKVHDMQRSLTERHAEYDPYAYQMPSRTRAEHNPYS
jgi:hypothetical protein